MPSHLVIGDGQVGKPLAKILQAKHEVFVRDIGQVPEVSDVDVMHVCFPYSGRLVREVIQYIGEYEPDLCIIHSTIVPGTTDTIGKLVDASLAYSPVKGRHGSMEIDLKRYTKFVAGDEALIAVSLFEDVGLKARAFPSTVGLELAKLLETTYSGLLIAWAQEMARYCDGVGLNYFDLMPFLAEVEYLPHAFQPGYIGGHCIIPNLDLLKLVKESPFLDAISASNAQMMPSGGERLYPIPMADFR